MRCGATSSASNHLLYVVVFTFNIPELSEAALSLASDSLQLSLIVITKC